MNPTRNANLTGQKNRLNTGVTRLLTILGFSCSAVAQVEVPSQRPLRNPPQTLVKPNLMITLDDSGSMERLYMPDESIRIGDQNVASPAASNYVRFDPRVFKDGLATDPSSEGLKTFRTSLASPTWQQSAMRSPDVNTVYYNPEVRYLPWLKVDGTRYPQASITAAVLNPMAVTSQTVDLSKSEQIKANWCTSSNFCEVETRTYRPGIYYRLQRDGSVFRDVTRPDNYKLFDVNDDTALALRPAKTLSRTDCTGERCTRQEERQNFANWFVYYRSRMHLAKAVLGEVLGRLDDRIRIGYGRLGYRPTTPPTLDGVGNFKIIESGVRDFNASRKAGVLDWLYALSPESDTPLLLATREVGRYYEVSDSRGPWGATPGAVSTLTQASCRAAYHLLITDGYWTDTVQSGALDPVNNVDGGTAAPTINLPNGSTWKYQPTTPYRDDNSDTLADFAMHYWYRDLQPNLTNNVPARPGNEAVWQSMSNFIVGLGVKGALDPAKDLPALTSGDKSWGTDRIDDLWHAALNSRGAYFSATNPVSLREALEQTLPRILGEDQSQAGVAVATQGLSVANRIYLPHYKASDWSGDLRAMTIGAAGLVNMASPLWSAGDRLPAWNERRLFTWDSGKTPPAGAAFDWSSLSSTLQAALTPPSMTTAEGADLVNYVRGDRSREGLGSWRVRGGLLGDFINSTPVVAADASDSELARLPTIGASYAGYVDTVKRARTRVVYIGGNGGMLHAFSDQVGNDGSLSGREIFAYVPRAVAPHLNRLRLPEYATASDGHRYFVDGPLREADVHVAPPGSSTPTWRNYLLGSTGAGPAAVFALDITDPAQLNESSLRWEIRAESEQRLGHVMTPVATGMLPNGKWVALFGNGFGSQSGKAHLFVVEVESGTVHAVVLPSTGTEANGLGGVALRRNPQGQVVGVYAGDLRGNLWRLDYNSDAAGFFVVGLDGKALFQAASGQAFVQAPLLRLQGDSVLVIAGTGRLITEADGVDSTVQAVYAVEDRRQETLALPLKPDQLVEGRLASVAGSGAALGQMFYSVSRSTVALTQQRGWRLPLQGVGLPTGLRVLQPLQLIRDLLLVGAEAPPVAALQAADPCAPAAAGAGVNLLLPLSDPLEPRVPAIDTNSDGRIDPSDVASVVGYRVAADGADAVFTTRPSPPASPPAVSTPTGGATPGQSSTPSNTTPINQCRNLVRLVSATGSSLICAGNLKLGDRVRRRILRPPF